MKYATLTPLTRLSSSSSGISRCDNVYPDNMDRGLSSMEIAYLLAMLGDIDTANLFAFRVAIFLHIDAGNSMWE